METETCTQYVTTDRSVLVLAVVLVVIFAIAVAYLFHLMLKNPATTRTRILLEIGLWAFVFIVPILLLIVGKIRIAAGLLLIDMLLLFWIIYVEYGRVYHMR